MDKREQLEALQERYEALLKISGYWDGEQDACARANDAKRYHEAYAKGLEAYEERKLNLASQVRVKYGVTPSVDFIKRICRNMKCIGSPKESCEAEFYNIFLKQ